MLSISSDNFFKPISNLRYTNIGDARFSNGVFDKLLFYPGNSKFIVDVSVFGDKQTLKWDDILITYGLHNDAVYVFDIAEKNISDILELCKSVQGTEFILDLDKMHIIESSDFIEALPFKGLNSLFIPSNDESDNKFYCLMNIGNSYKDSEIFSWFLSYIYSSSFCLSPVNETSETAKQFLYSMSKLLYSRINPEQEITIPVSPYILNRPLGDFGKIFLEIPGKFSRLNILMEKALTEKNRRKGKNK